ncbi:MAG: HipA domain-containing protein [Acidimicrobiales bacterium]
MAGPEPLAVWLSGEHVATVELKRSGLRLFHTEEAQRNFGLNVPLLSMSMPVSGRPYGPAKVGPFLDGLLPEGEIRRSVAYDLGLADTDTFGLLAELGRDCAGALVIQPISADPPELCRVEQAEPIDDTEVGRRLAALQRAPLGIDDRVRLSLAGVQGKLLLTRLPGGGWALPLNGVPSTHILKPAAAMAHMVENEAFCLRVAHHLGLAGAEVEVTDIAGRRVLVVTRFDRRRLASGEIVRIHQEDMCQALSIPPQRKYEEHGGPSLCAVAELLNRWRASEDDLEQLLRIVTLSIALGNADLHGKNLTILLGPDGRLQLAPIYDVTVTRAYSWVSPVAGMFVNGVHNVDDITPADLMAEAERWKLPTARARHIVATMLHALPDAIDAAASDIADVPDEILALVRARVAEVVDERGR